MCAETKRKTGKFAAMLHGWQWYVRKIKCMFYISTYINRMTSNQKGNKNNVASKRDTMRKEQFPARKTEGSPRKRISRVCLQYSTLSPQKNRKFGRGKYAETSKTSGCAPRNSKKAWKKKNSRTILRLPFFFAIKTFDFDKWKWENAQLWMDVGRLFIKRIKITCNLL